MAAESIDPDMRGWPTLLQNYRIADANRAFL